MKFMLIILFMVSEPCPNVTLDQVEFDNLRACRKAGLLIYGSKIMQDRRNYQWECVQVKHE